MNKAELIEQIAISAQISKIDAGRALDAMIIAMRKSLKKGYRVVLVGFGTFYIKKRGAHKSRNPKTGESLIVPPRKYIKFKNGLDLEKSLNS